MKQIILSLAVSLVMFIGVRQTQAITIINFEILANSGTGSTTGGPSYSESGFTITNSATHPNAFAAFQTENENFAGSTMLFSNFLPSTITLTKDDATPFELISIDLIEFFKGQNPAPVTFTGTKVDLSTISMTFNLDGNFQVETFAFTGFSNLTSVRWDQGPPIHGHQFDNIALAPVAPIPEPSTLALFGLGTLGMFGFLRKRRNKS